MLSKQEANKVFTLLELGCAAFDRGTMASDKKKTFLSTEEIEVIKDIMNLGYKAYSEREAAREAHIRKMSEALDAHNGVRCVTLEIKPEDQKPFMFSDVAIGPAGEPPQRVMAKEVEHKNPAYEKWVIAYEDQSGVFGKDICYCWYAGMSTNQLVSAKRFETEKEAKEHIAHFFTAKHKAYPIKVKNATLRANEVRTKEEAFALDRRVQILEEELRKAKESENLRMIREFGEIKERLAVLEKEARRIDKHLDGVQSLATETHCSAGASYANLGDQVVALKQRIEEQEHLYIHNHPETKKAIENLSNSIEEAKLAIVGVEEKNGQSISIIGNRTVELSDECHRLNEKTKALSDIAESHMERLHKLELKKARSK